MKKLIKNIIIFFSPILIVLILLPVDKRLKYQGLKDDCLNHGIWIYDRLFINKKPIDIVFLGSSHTINGINDKLISENINCGNAVNLGYCRLGTNLSYIFLKEIIAKKQIKHLVLEIREDEDRYSHPVFPHVASSSDVLLPILFFNRDILDDIWTHITYKTEIIQDFIYQKENVTSFSTEDYGFSASRDTVSNILLDKIIQERILPKSPMTEFERNFYMSFPRKYLSKIHTLCSEHNIQITFLYLPSYCAHSEKPKELKTYSKYGKVLFIPTYILENKNNWHDENHLNQTGANELSLWLSAYINNNWH